MEITRDELIMEALDKGLFNVNFESQTVYYRNKPAKTYLIDGYLHLHLQINKVCKHVRVHRVIWMAKHGRIPKGLMTDHINRNRTDNRLENLRLVTLAESNKNRAISGEDSHNAKFTWEDIRKIRERLKTETQTVIAKDYEVAGPTISDIARGKSWKEPATP